MKIIMIVLGIETSCDETSVALYDESNGIIGHIIHSQIDLHRHYGGVVPELASRDHVKKLGVITQKICRDANITFSAIDLIAYTAGPGLAGALMVGAGFAASLAFSLGIKKIAVNHLEAHILAAMINNKELKFPFLSLLVSGGHTQIIFAEKLGKYNLLGDTRDDAVGELLDKSAKMIGIPYPGGKELSELALKGDSSKYKFTKPMINRTGMEMSFSGLKTAFSRQWQELNYNEACKQDLAASLQETVVDTLIIKLQRALKLTNASSIVVAGGVAANWQLRAKLKELATVKGLDVFFPTIELCTDNGAMVAFAGYMHYNTYNTTNSELAVQIYPRWQTGSLD
jgi:N6-L-threonylcarbamoyladenine synthase